MNFLIFFLILISESNAQTLPVHPSLHTPLRTRNDFKTPEEVVLYFCNRNAEGFLWLGLTESERKEFTLWKTVPSYDSYFLAKKFQIFPTRFLDINRVEIQVEYDLTGLSDAHGTRMPPPQLKYRVTFELKKIQKKWLILEPSSSKIMPILKE
jgi:hypothetical protein